MEIFQIEWSAKFGILSPIQWQPQSRFLLLSTLTTSSWRGSYGLCWIFTWSCTLPFWSTWEKPWYDSRTTQYVHQRWYLHQRLIELELLSSPKSSLTLGKSSGLTLPTNASMIHHTLNTFKSTKRNIWNTFMPIGIRLSFWIGSEWNKSKFYLNELVRLF